MYKGIGCIVYLIVIFIIGVTGSYYYIFKKENEIKARVLKPEINKILKNNETEKLKEIILKNKKAIKADDLSGWALICSIHLHNTEVLKLLLEAGADVNYEYSCYSNEVITSTPLLYASDLGFADLVEMLLKNKADKYKLNKNNQNALSVSCTKKYEYNYLFGLLDSILDIKKDPEAVKEKMNKVEYAGQINIIKLLTYGYNKKDFTKDVFNSSAYDYALKEGDKEIINYLKNFLK